MSRTLTGETLICLLLLVGSLTGKNVTKTYSLSDVDTLQLKLQNLNSQEPHLSKVSIDGNRTVCVNVTNVSSSAAFMIFQIHVYQYNVTLAYDEESLNRVSNKSVFGSNIGLFSRVTGDIITQFFVKNDNPNTVDALLVTVLYNDKAPVPGGCNMEFATEIAPYARVQTLPQMIIVDVQPPSMPLQGIALPKCNMKTNPVTIEMYQMFLSEQDFSSEGYFSAISSMLSMQDVKANGIEIANSNVTSPMRRVFTAYTGVGSVYVALAKYGENYAVYVPAFSYACYPITDPDSCKVISGFVLQFVNFFCLLLSILLIIFKCPTHLINIDESIVLLFFGTVIGYMLHANIGIAILISFGFMILVNILRFVSYPFYRVLFSTMTMGFSCASLLYYYLPDSFIAIHNNTVFWPLFVIIACGAGICTSFLYKLGQMGTCFLSVGLMAVLPIDNYAGSNLKYIFINVIRRATVEGFHLASIQNIIQTKDIILIVLWIGLALYYLVSHSLTVKSEEKQPLLSEQISDVHQNL